MDNYEFSARYSATSTPNKEFLKYVVAVILTGYAKVNMKKMNNLMCEIQIKL